MNDDKRSRLGKIAWNFFFLSFLSLSISTRERRELCNKAIFRWCWWPAPLYNDINSGNNSLHLQFYNFQKVARIHRTSIESFNRKFEFLEKRETNYFYISRSFNLHWWYILIISLSYIWLVNYNTFRFMCTQPLNGIGEIFFDCLAWRVPVRVQEEVIGRRLGM